MAGVDSTTQGEADHLAPVGAVLGALTVTLAASFLTFLNIAPDWQIGMQGLNLVAVLGLRAAIDLAGGKR